VVKSYTCSDVFVYVLVTEMPSKAVFVSGSSDAVHSASISKVTTLWHYTNLFITIIIVVVGLNSALTLLVYVSERASSL